MKRFKNNLDEMQEEKLLKIEHFGMWLAFWGLVAAAFLQVIGGADLKQLAGEGIILMILCIYLLTACLKNGIWDRHLKPNLKTNLLVSLLAAVAVAAITVIKPLQEGITLAYLPITASFSAVFTFLLCFGALQLAVLVYRKRRTKLESCEEDDNEPHEN
ncbi:MAG TPA: hypothetical protein PKD52_02635 [Clostridiales bacterium]|nr:hypothetical protein [Clostridiales bacterium]